MTVSLSMRAAWQQVAAEAEAIMTRHRMYSSSPVEDFGVSVFCRCCGDLGPCFTRKAAERIRVTALAQINALNEAERVVNPAAPEVSTGMRVIADPQEPTALDLARADTCADYGHDYVYLEDANVTICNHCAVLLVDAPRNEADA